MALGRPLGTERRADLIGLFDNPTGTQLYYFGVTYGNVCC
jgi:hypothetical protein